VHADINTVKVTMWKESTSVLNHFNPKSLLAALCLHYSVTLAKIDGTLESAYKVTTTIYVVIYAIIYATKQKSN